MPVGQYGRNILLKMQKMYSALFPYSDRLVKCLCNDCNAVHVFRKSMGYYYCHRCKGFNVDEREGHGTML